MYGHMFQSIGFKEGFIKGFSPCFFDRFQKLHDSQKLFSSFLNLHALMFIWFSLCYLLQKFTIHLWQLYMLYMLSKIAQQTKFFPSACCYFFYLWPVINYIQIKISRFSWKREQLLQTCSLTICDIYFNMKHF